MSSTKMAAFADELEKIKEAGVVKDLGTKITKAVGPMARGMYNNAVGAVKSFATPGQSWSRGVEHLKRDWHGVPSGAMVRPGDKPSPRKSSLGSKVNKGLMVVGTGLGVAEIAPKEDPTGRGRSRLQRTAGFIGNQAANVLTAPFGVTGGIVGGVIGQTAGEVVGKGIDKVRGYKPPPKKKSTNAAPAVVGPSSALGSGVAQKVIG